MYSKNFKFISFIILMSLMMSLVFPVGAVFADDTPPPAPETPEVITSPDAAPTEAAPQEVAPTEPPTVTDVPTEAAPQEVAPTEPPTVTAVPTEAASADTSSTVSEVLSQVPAGTDVVVLNTGGEVLPLASQVAADIIEVVDPMWCPAGILPGGVGCTIDFSNSQALIDAMDASNPASTALPTQFEQNGIIYFTLNPGSGSFILAPGNGNNNPLIETNDYNIFKQFNLILQGGWNGVNLAGATFTGQTTFGANALTIGDSNNPWGGNITLNNFAFSGVSSTNAVTIYTTTGNIILDNVDVLNQTGNGDFNTALLSSTSGNITVQNGSSFDGDNSNNNFRNRGFSATTGGSISISDTTFQQAFRSNSTSRHGATLSAPNITLTNVTAQNNVGNGILVSGINNNATVVKVTGGSFINNGGYGLQLTGNGGGRLYVGTAPTCTGNGLGGGSCYSLTPSTDNTNPTIAFVSRTPVNGLNGWNTGDVTVTWSCTDTGSGPLLSTITQTVTTEGANQSVTGTCQDWAGNIASNTQTGIKIDKTGPTGVALVASGTFANGWYRSNVTISTSGVDAVSGIASCTPVQSQTSETTGTVFNGLCTNGAGLASNAAPLTVKIDKTQPSITVPASMTVEAPSPAGATVTFTPSATDILSGILSLTCSPASNSLFAFGTTSVTCTATDTAGNTRSGSFSVTVQDKTAPVVTVPSNMTVEASGSTGAVVTFTASALDSVDGARTTTCLPASGSTFAIGATTVTCSATDVHGNTGSASFTITVQDKTAPGVTVPSNMTVEATGSSGAAVSFTSSAADIVDGSLTPTCSPVSGSTFAIGTTTVTCSATDAHNNTGSATFTVTVRDTTPPIVTVPANISTEATGLSGATVSFTAFATDVVDGSLTPTCLPVSGSTFAIGTTTVICSATDAHSNTGSATFTVTVGDATAPIVTVPANITTEATGSSGAAVSFTSSAADIVDGSLTPTCSPVSGSTFAIGTTTVICSATDIVGNTGSASFAVTVEDTTAPVVIVPANLTKEATSSAGAIASFTSSAADIVDGSITPTCSPVSGSTFAIGTTTVICSATDVAGNTGSASFVIQVTEAENGKNAANTGPITLLGNIPFLIPVTGGQPTDLSCAKTPTIFEMAGFQVTFTDLCGYSTMLGEAPEESLFKALPNDNKFVSGINIALLQDGSSVNTLPAGANITLSFDIPSGMTGENLSILFWDTVAGAWVEKSVTIESGKVTLKVNMPGTFVLVDKSASVSMNKPAHIATALKDLYWAMVDFFNRRWSISSTSGG